MLIGVAAWGVAPPPAAAQSDAVVIELNFETTTGQTPPAGLAVLDVSTGIEYRNAGVADGEAIEVPGSSGIASEFQIRRAALQPGDVSCEGADSAQITASGRVAITPGADRVVCTVTLSDELPVTGVSSTVALIGATLLGAGALMVVASRSTNY